MYQPEFGFENNNLSENPGGESSSNINNEKSEVKEKTSKPKIKNKIFSTPEIKSKKVEDTKDLVIEIPASSDDLGWDCPQCELIGRTCPRCVGKK
jgi:hypothetical protein